MQELSEALGSSARQDAGEPDELSLEPTNLALLLREAVAELYRGEWQHEVRLEADADELIGQWDPRRQRRVVANLLNNAAKYSPAGGDIIARLARANGEAVLQV